MSNSGEIMATVYEVMIAIVFRLKWVLLNSDKRANIIKVEAKKQQLFNLLYL